MTVKSSQLTQEVDAYLSGSSSAADAIAAQGSSSLPVLKDYLQRDLPIDATERVEALLKGVLRGLLREPMPGSAARELAAFQQDLGFVLKYKSYAIKASTPVGYSVFLQNEGQGFSFQRHIEHKLEVFHILDVLPGGFIFLCEFEQWEAVYERESFERWLAGEPNAAYDQFRFVPQVGDVFQIDQLGTVHTVIGCVLEEYATVSTDMVKRLHDQNSGRPFPEFFRRKYALEGLSKLSVPRKNRDITGFAQNVIAPIRPEKVEGGERNILCDSFIRAARYFIEPNGATAPERDDRRITLLRVSGGQCSIRMADSSERLGAVPELNAGAGDLILIAPGIQYAIRNPGPESLAYSEQRIAPDVAFI